MQTVVELYSFKRAAAQAGMTADEVEALTTFLAKNPEAGDEMQGTGGCRKFRLAGRGKGKSGGYRVVTFYSGVDVPVFLITVFGKGEKANLSAAERNSLKLMTTELVAEYSKRVRKIGRGRT